MLEVSSADIGIVSDLAFYGIFVVYFGSKIKGRVSITMFGCQSFDLGTWSKMKVQRKGLMGSERGGTSSPLPKKKKKKKHIVGSRLHNSNTN